MIRKLNLDVASRITEFELLMKEFLLKKQLYRILFRGKGLEFDSYRDYASDDDSGDIDWKASMRTNKLLVKRYIEERDLKIVIAVDVSNNMIFGSSDKIKCEYAAELAAALAHLIVISGDKMGFILFNNNIVKIISPEAGIQQFQRFVFELENPLIYGGKSDIKKSLESVLEYLDESINSVILISDFIKIKKNSSETLSMFAKRFETMAIIIRDRLDISMPNIRGELILEDPETGEQMIVDPSVAGLTYEKIALQQEKMVEAMFKEAGIDSLKLSTDIPFVPSLAEFLNERVEKKKYIISA